MTNSVIISCQLSLHPYAEDYVEVIREVLEEFDYGDLHVETGAMSTTLIGAEDLVWLKIRELYDLARKKEPSFRLEITLSTGCV